jgi:hypothetical protein
MTQFFTNPLPRSAYFRLMEHQGRIKPSSYEPDYPLIFFISFSRIAAGISLISVFFRSSFLWTTMGLGFMILATISAIAHLNVPARFLTMVRNNRSHLVWEIRLAGALTAFLTLQFLSFLGWFKTYQAFFPWINFFLALLFLLSTGWAYRFETHPAWRSWTLPIYYLASASMVGIALCSIGSSSHLLPLVYVVLLLVQVSLLGLYRNHLKLTSPMSLKKILMDKEKWVFLSFLWATLFLPALLTLALLIEGEGIMLNLVMAISYSAGVFLERVLSFWVEKPIFSLSFIENPEINSKYPYWIRG